MFFCGAEKWWCLCVFRWKRASVWKLLFPSSRGILCFHGIPDIFPASAPSLGADNPLVSYLRLTCLQNSLFLLSDRTDSRKQWEGPVPGHAVPLKGEAALRHACDGDYYACAGFLSWFQGGWLSGDLSPEQVKHGLRFSISPFKPDLLKKKKTWDRLLIRLSPYSVINPALWPCRWK